MLAGSRTARTIVASMRTASARPTPISLKSMELSVARIENTPIITVAALVTMPCRPDPVRDRLVAAHAAVVALSDAAEDEHVVIAIRRCSALHRAARWATFGRDGMTLSSQAPPEPQLTLIRPYSVDRASGRNRGGSLSP
jgi:hypothetical protein